MWGCGGDSAVQPHSMGGVRGGKGGTHTHTHTQEHTHTHTQEHTHTGTYTRMLHLPLSDLPLKNRGFLNLGFGEPRFCTPDSRGFRHFRGFRDLCYSSTQSSCLWKSAVSLSFS